MRAGQAFAPAALAAVAILVVALAVPLASDGALTVVHTPPTDARTGVPIHIEVTVSADAPVQRVEVLPVSSSYFTNFTLTLIHGTETYGVWSGDIPAQETGGVLEYRVEVTRADSWTQDYDYNLTVAGGTSGGGGLDLPTNGWVLFVGGVIILVIFFILEIPLKRRFLDRVFRKKDAEEPERKARRVKKE